MVFIKKERCMLDRRDTFVFICIFLVVLVTRIPWLSAGYGSDDDSYRVIDSAAHIAQTLEYKASRLPGYPAYEYLLAFTAAKSSPLISNFLTALASSIAALFFALILRSFNVRQYALLSFSFAMTPVVYINSTCTMDYMFAACLILGSTYFVLIHRNMLAGLFLGLAIGFRITSGAMLLPFIILILMEGYSLKSIKRISSLTLITLLVGGICFLPVIKSYGMGFFTFYEFELRYHIIVYWLYKGIIEVWGIIGTIGIICVVFFGLFSLSDIKQRFKQANVRRCLIFALVASLIYIFAFLRLPHQAGYLITVVPFIILSIALLFPQKIIKCFGVLLILSSFFIYVGEHELKLSGPILQDHLNRKKNIEMIVNTASAIPENSVLVVHERLLRFIYTVEGNLRDQSRFVYLIKDREQYENYVEKGFDVYFLPGVDEINLRIFGVDLRKLGAEQIEDHNGQ